jgi:hypothetical protein
MVSPVCAKCLLCTTRMLFRYSHVCGRRDAVALLKRTALHWPHRPLLTRQPV